MGQFFKTMLGTVLVKVYFDGKELQHPIERFEYVYDEEGEDLCNITMNTLEEDSPNYPEFQERAKLIVQWGYIGGPVRERKVFVDDPKWTFDKNGRKIILACINKAITTKQTRSKKIHKGVTLPELTKEVAERHGLNAYLEVTNEQSGETEIHDLRAPDSKWKSAVGDEFKLLTNIPQANKTDYHLLEEQGRREPKGEWQPVTRDDAIILRKRNFSKKPHRSYTYERDKGELLSFNPETKNKSTLGTSLASMFSAWDSANKKFIAGIQDQMKLQLKGALARYWKATGLALPEDHLYPNYSVEARDNRIVGLVNQIVDNEGKSAKTGKTKNVLGHEVDEYENDFVAYKLVNQTSSGQRNDFGVTRDNTSKVLRGKVPVTGEELYKAVKDATSGNLDNFHDETANNLDDAAGPSANNIGRNAMQRNPASALHWGDATLESGQVITYLGVGKKYEGNYLVIKCTHVIEEGSGFTVTTELAREGHNVKASENDMAVKKASKLINKEIGTDHNSMRRRTLQTRKNGN